MATKQENWLQTDSCWNRALDDEEIFILLGRDPAAPAAIRAWARERVRTGKNNRLDDVILRAAAVANRMEAQRDKFNADRKRGEPCGVNPGVPLDTAGAVATGRRVALTLETVAELRDRIEGILRGNGWEEGRNYPPGMCSVLANRLTPRPVLEITRHAEGAGNTIRCEKHIPAGYAACTRPVGHDGPCAHPLLPPEPPDVHTRASVLLEAIKKHRDQKADDRCWMDDNELYAAAGLEPADIRVGDKKAMIKNCERFLDTRCAGGGWPSYAELEARLAAVAPIWREAAPDAEGYWWIRFPGIEDKIIWMESFRGEIKHRGGHAVPEAGTPGLRWARVPVPAETTIIVDDPAETDVAGWWEKIKKHMEDTANWTREANERQRQIMETLRGRDVAAAWNAGESAARVAILRDRTQLLSAICSGRARFEPWFGDGGRNDGSGGVNCVVVGGQGPDGHVPADKIFPSFLDGDGCPVLSAECRAALLAEPAPVRVVGDEEVKRKRQWINGWTAAIQTAPAAPEPGPGATEHYRYGWRAGKISQATAEADAQTYAGG